MKMKKRLIWLVVLALLLGVASPALAQGEQPELALKLRRDWGYGGFNGDIQGNFSVTVDGPADLAMVRYYLDDETLLGESSEAPSFRVAFVTDDYPPGQHTLVAVGVRADGTELRSQELVRLFVSGEQAGEMLAQIGVPLAVIVVALLAVTALAPLLSTGRKKAHRPGEYGWLGGAVCPKCGKPYRLSALGLKLGFSRLENCPHCRKWSMVRRAGPDELAAAEARLAAEDGAGGLTPELDAQETLRKQLDDTRYD